MNIPACTGFCDVCLSINATEADGAVGIYSRPATAPAMTGGSGLSDINRRAVRLAVASKPAVELVHYGGLQRTRCL